MSLQHISERSGPPHRLHSWFDTRCVCLALSCSSLGLNLCARLQLIWLYKGTGIVLHRCCRAWTEEEEEEGGRERVMANSHLVVLKNTWNAFALVTQTKQDFSPSQEVFFFSPFFCMCFPQHHLQPTNQSATHLWSSAEEKQHVDFRRYQKNGLYMTILVNTGQWNKALRFQLGLKTDFLEEQLRSRWACFHRSCIYYFFCSLDTFWLSHCYIQTIFSTLQWRFRGLQSQDWRVERGKRLLC